MLEIINAGSAELSRTGSDRDFLLNSWDNSSPLIRELERTVNFAERKCGDLMQKLHFYKEYYEKWAQVERFNHVCQNKKIKKLRRRVPDVGSSSENEFEKANSSLYKKIQSKIVEMNNDITEANRKIHSKSKEFSPLGKINSPTSLRPEEILPEEYDPPRQVIEHKTCKSEPTMASCDINAGVSAKLKVTTKQSSKSVPTRNRTSKSLRKDSMSCKKRFSHLQRYKLRSKSLPQGVRRKFGFGGFFEVFEPEAVFGDGVKPRSKSRISLKAESSKSCKSRKSKTRLSETRKLSPKSSRHRVMKTRSDIKHSFKSAAQDSEFKKSENTQAVNPVQQKVTKREANTCKAVVPSNSVQNLARPEIALNDNLKNFIAQPNSIFPFLRHPIPFIPCSSTSKSFNLGLNIQQVLSLIKRKRHSVMLQAIIRNSMQAARSLTEPTVNTLFISQTTTSHSHVTSALCPARECSEDSFSIVTDHRSKCSLLRHKQATESIADKEQLLSPEGPIFQITKVERPEDVWVVEQPDTTSKEIRKFQSRCTCFPSKHCVDYHKVLRQYTGWRLPAGPHNDARSSFLCTKSKFYSMPSRDNQEGNDARVELMKVHSDLASLTRKCSSLQEQISQKCLDDYEANAELDAMESELTLREIEFKDVLSFYNQLMMLKEKLKTLRGRNGLSRRAAREPGSQQPKKDPLRPTPSMALAKVLKKIQGLQDKIKLIDAS